MEDDISANGNLGISSYGVSMTTLEEVFLHLGEEEEAENADESNEIPSLREKVISRQVKFVCICLSYFLSLNKIFSGNFLWGLNHVQAMEYQKITLNYPKTRTQAVTHLNL